MRLSVLEWLKAQEMVFSIGYLFWLKVFAIGLLAVGAVPISSLHAQVLLRGEVKDVQNEEPLVGVNLYLLEAKKGAISDANGRFTLELEKEEDVLRVSYVGYESQELSVSTSMTFLEIQLNESAILGREIIVSASLAAEDYMASPVSIEFMRTRDIQRAPSPDYYESLAHLPGVSMNTSSINLSTINTRGFGHIANFHFVQLIDWMDSASPTLNFPTGNLVGISELDLEGVEILPGASSALYGPNAFNGLLLMKSKSPFEYSGLSAQVKMGFTDSDATTGWSPMLWSDLRYAKNIQDRFGVKVNLGWMQAREWVGNDYLTDRIHNRVPVARIGQPDFDGLNLYGDEIDIPIPMPSPYAPIRIRRTGFSEEDLLGDDQVAHNLKADAGLYYRYRGNNTLSYHARYGLANSMIHAADKYVLRGFGQFFHKLEWQGAHYFARAYTTGTHAGRSYNLGAVGLLANEAYSPTVSWVNDYITRYILTIQGHTDGVVGGDESLAHASARAYADRLRPERDSPEYAQLISGIKSQPLPKGGGFKDFSRLYHLEGSYNFKELIPALDLQLGGNYRLNDIFSDGTIFNEAPEEDQVPRHFYSRQAGVYAQFAKGLFHNIWQLKGSIRYDKKQNFRATYTPRLSSVLCLGPQHFVRTSYQTAFRNPDSQAQYIYFFTSDGIVLGSSEENAARYGIHNGGAYTFASYQAYLASGGSLDEETGKPIGGEQALLQSTSIPYVDSEHLQSMEIGYRGVFRQALLVDASFYYNFYRDFITSEVVVSKHSTHHQGDLVPAGTRYRPFINVPDRIHAYGIGLSARYRMREDFWVASSYNYADFRQIDNTSTFTPAFNTPQHKFSASLSGEELIRRLGAGLSFRWQDRFVWRAPMGEWEVPSYGVLDLEIHYPMPTLKAFVKFGGTNLLQADYRSQLGGPFIGRQYYISIRYDASM